MILGEYGKMTTEEFYGEYLVNKYKSIYPLMRLVTYRLDAFELKDPKSLLFYYDGGWGKSIKSLLYPFSGLARYFKKKSGSGDIHVLLSDTILKSSRYGMLIDRIKKGNELIGGICTWYNCGYLNRNCVLLDKNICLGKYIIPKKLKAEISNLYDYFDNMLKLGLKCEDDLEYVDSKLNYINKMIVEALEKTKKELTRRNVKLYITCNQYSVDECIMIMASRQLGIKTKEWQHHSCYLYPKPCKPYEKIYNSLRFDENSQKYACVEVESLWSRADVNWMNKWGCDFICGKNAKYEIVGGLEIDENKIIQYINKYKKNGIIFFVPEAVFFDYDSTIKKRLNNQLEKLSNKYNLKVYIRFHPGEVQEDYVKLCDEYGFEILQDTYEELIRGICSSWIGFGYCTSAIDVAKNYGLKMYQLDLFDENFEIRGTSVETVRIEEISKLKIFFELGEIAADRVDYKLLFS